MCSRVRGIIQSCLLVGDLGQRMAETLSLKSAIFQRAFAIVLPRRELSKGVPLKMSSSSWPPDSPPFGSFNLYHCRGCSMAGAALWLIAYSSMASRYRSLSFLFFSRAILRISSWVVSSISVDAMSFVILHQNRFDGKIQ